MPPTPQYHATTASMISLYTGNSQHNTSYDPYAIIQCVTVMAIYFTECGNRNRRCGNTKAAKQSYRCAIQLHEYVHQLAAGIGMH